MQRHYSLPSALLAGHVALDHPLSIGIGELPGSLPIDYHFGCHGCQFQVDCPCTHAGSGVDLGITSVCCSSTPEAMIVPCSKPQPFSARPSNPAEWPDHFISWNCTLAFPCPNPALRTATRTGSASHGTTGVDHLGYSFGSCDTLMSWANEHTDVAQVSSFYVIYRCRSCF
jgi:hypothetical protein